MRTVTAKQRWGAIVPQAEPETDSERRREHLCEMDRLELGALVAITLYFDR